MAMDVGSGSKLEIFFFPFLAPGHMIPVADIAKLFAARGAKSTLLTTTYYEQMFHRSIQRAQKLGSDLRILTMELPLQEVGLPEHCQNLDSISSIEMRMKYLMAVRKLEEQFERLVEEHRPDCVVSDMFLPWTVDVLAKFGIPRIVFHGTSHFAMGASECVRLYEPHTKVSADSEPFLIPNFPGEISMTGAKLPEYIREVTHMTEFNRQMMESETRSYGVIMNSFYELEPAYADYYGDALGRRLWSVGPVFLCTEDFEEKLQRWGKSASAGTGDGDDDGDGCLKWLDSKKPNSVVYICFGSMTKFTPLQLREIALGLEASGQQFVWVVKKEATIVEGGKEDWLPQGYEERMRDKGLIIRGWAPQVMILDHDAVGGFVTHCGWNSTLEGIAAGVPMVTWPVGAEQFYNEKLVTEVLRIGVQVGVQRWVKMTGDWVECGKVEAAVRRVMVGEEAEGMRVRAAQLSEAAKKAVEEGGSSHSDLTALLEELKASKSKALA